MCSVPPVTSSLLSRRLSVRSVWIIFGTLGLELAAVGRAWCARATEPRRKGLVRSVHAGSLDR